MSHGEVDVISVAQAIMQLGDRFQRNGRLTITEMRTFLAGTVYQQFAEWLSEGANFSRFDADHNGAINLTELKDAVREYMIGTEEDAGPNDDVHQTLLDHSVAIGNMFDACSTGGAMSASQFYEFASQYDLTPALLSSATIGVLFDQRATNGVVGYGEFAQLIAICAFEAFPGDSKDNTNPEEQVTALMVYMGQQPNKRGPSSPHQPTAVSPPQDSPGSAASLPPELQEVGLWQIAQQIQSSIEDLDNNSSSKRALAGPAFQLKQVLALNRIVEAREQTMQKVMAGLNFENQVFEQKIAAVAQLAGRYSSRGDSIFSKIKL